MAKEPAGLRRWRLAHRKHKRRRVVHTMARRRRYRYARKGKGRRGSHALPMAQSLMIGFPIYQAYKANGFTTGALNSGLYNLTGFDASQGKWTDPTRGISMGIGLLLLSTVGSKLANRSGANRLVKKFSAGMIKIA